MAFKDITGQKFGRLTAIRRAGKQGNHLLWEFRCDCGKTVIALGINVKSGKMKSCGCLRAEQGREQLSTHGLSNTRLHEIWKSMRQRCNNPKNPSYPNYGGRGIAICPEWDDFKLFFDWAILHGYKDGLQIDRIDNDGDYCPENCRWADEKTQSNNRRSNTWLECRGERHTVAEWSDLTGIKQSTILVRMMKYGWSVEQALFTPVRGMKRTG